MIDLVTADDLSLLTKTFGDHVVSLFVPTEPTGPEQGQGRLRLKNLLSQAGTELEAAGVPAAQARELLAPATALLDQPDFWAHVEHGLALYLGDDMGVSFRLAHPLAELLVIADRFHLKPLIPAMAAGSEFHVLALSQHEIRLLRGDALHLSDVALGEVPSAMAEALRWDDRERQLMSHGAGRVGRGRMVAAFHGQGGTKDTTREDLARFFRIVDEGVVDIVGPTAPLVLAGVERLLPIYREVSVHPRIVDGGVIGNPERATGADLHAQAWQLAQPAIREGRRLAVDRFLNGSQPTSGDIVEIVLSAIDGAVATLFVPLGVQLWGVVEPGTRRVELHADHQPGDRDLLDVAAVETITHGGEVHVVAEGQVPGGEPAAAVLRF